MTQAALQFDAHTLLLGLLGMVCGFLAYWGTRLEQRVDELKARQCLLAEDNKRFCFNCWYCCTSNMLYINSIIT